MNIFKFICCFAALVVASCSKEKMETLQFTVPILNPAFTLRLHDRSNADLLDPATKGSYRVGDIKIGIVNKKGDFIVYSGDDFGNKTEIKYLDEVGYYLLIPTPIPTDNKPLKVPFVLQIGTSIDKFEVLYNPSLLPEAQRGYYKDRPLPIETIWHNGAIIWHNSVKLQDGEILKSSTPILVKEPKQ